MNLLELKHHNIFSTILLVFLSLSLSGCFLSQQSKENSTTNVDQKAECTETISFQSITKNHTVSSNAVINSMVNQNQSDAQELNINNSTLKLLFDNTISFSEISPTSVIANGSIKISVQYLNKLNSKKEKLYLKLKLNNADGLQGSIQNASILPLEYSIDSGLNFSQLTQNSINIFIWDSGCVNTNNDVITLNLKTDFSNALAQNYIGTIEISAVLSVLD